MPSVRHLLLLGLLHVELDGEADKLGVLLDQILQASLLRAHGGAELQLQATRAVFLHISTI